MINLKEPRTIEFKKTITTDRYNKIYEDYQKLLDENRDKVEFLARSYYYKELAKKHFLSDKVIARIIRDKIRGRI